MSQVLHNILSTFPVTQVLHSTTNTLLPIKYSDTLDMSLNLPPRYSSHVQYSGGVAPYCPSHLSLPPKSVCPFHIRGRTLLSPSPRRWGAVCWWDFRAQNERSGAGNEGQAEVGGSNWPSTNVWKLLLLVVFWGISRHRLDVRRFSTWKHPGNCRKERNTKKPIKAISRTPQTKNAYICVHTCVCV